MRAFDVTVRTNSHSMSYTAPAKSSSDAWMAAAELHGDVPCGVSVKPASAGLNIVFLYGHIHAVRKDSCDRRFMVINATAARPQ